MTHSIVRAAEEDAQPIWELQRCAYQTEAVLYNDYSIPPLVETLETLQSLFSQICILKAVVDSRIVGAVRASLKSGTCYVGRLIVHPDYRRRGIGSDLLRAIEAAHPAAERFELFTGHKSVDNLRLYERLGYRPFRREPVNDGLTMVFLEKLIR
jgi:ribosomal protein S18 acetylase RimI-like enzyme